MDYSILKGFMIAFFIQQCTSEEVASSIQSLSAVSLHDESPALLQEQEPSAHELIPVVAPPSLQEVQQAVQEASEKEGQGAEEVLKGLLERVVEAALGAADSTGEAKVDEPAAVTTERAGMENDSQTGEVEQEAIVEDTSLEQEQTDALTHGTAVVEENSEAITTDVNKMETQQVPDALNKNVELSSDVPADKDSAAQLIVSDERVQETVEQLDLRPSLVLDVEQEFAIEKTHEIIDADQSVAEAALEQAIDSNILQDNEMPRTGDVEGNLVVQEVGSEQVDNVEMVGMGDGETVIEGGSIVPGVTDGSEAGVGEAAPEATNSSEDKDQEEPQTSDKESPESEAGVVIEGLQQSAEPLPETLLPSPSLSETDTEESVLEDEKVNHDTKLILPTEDQAPAQPTQDSAVQEVLVLLPEIEEELPGKATGLVEDATQTGETSALGLEAWKIGAICAAVLLLLETVVIMAYILRNWSKNSSSRLRGCEEGSVEPEATTGADYNDDTLPAGNGEAQQNSILDPSKVAAALLQNKGNQEVEQVIAMSELPVNSEEDTSNSRATPEPSEGRRTSAL